MPSTPRIVFPFRRLAIWLSVLLLAVASLAVGLTALLVIPSLNHNLVQDRISDVNKSARAIANQFNGDESTTRQEELATTLEQLTGFQVAIAENVSGNLVPFAGHVSGPLDDSLLRAALQTRNAQLGEVRVDGRYAAELAVPTSDGHYVLIVASPLNDVSRTVSTVKHEVFLAVAIALPVAWVVGLLAAFALSQRIRRLERAARRIAAGNLATPVVDEGRDEIHELAVAFDQMRVELDRTDRARRAFIANASHELRTPLFAIAGFLELLDEEDDPASRHEFVSTMRAQVDRLTRLTTDLLDLSRLDSGSVELVRGEVDLGDIAGELASAFVPVAAEREATIIAGNPPVVAIADEARVAQIGRALVANALRHNPPGVEVVISAGVDESGAYLLVHDDGPPIDENVADRLFERFFRGPASAEGSGLGLAIARELALRMEGALEFEQDPDVPGKAFRLTLPAAERPAVTMLGA
jgi:signal transduction histidine kinase